MPRRPPFLIALIIIAPAEIKKRGVTWDRRRVCELSPDERWLNSHSET